MSLAPGTRLGPYEVIAQIGVGGMGEVYRATDTNLGRQVAIKVLPEAFAQDADRLARFEREAKTLASLNHPNIAQIYGLEKSAGIHALVMELVEGPTLADRLSQVGRVPRSGPAGLPLDEALPIAKQIADALEAAHERGIIHRDLKPANIKVRPDGVVKLLDFGLAKAMAPDPVADLSNSPTLSLAATQAGMILGTAGYMSPEQARGKDVDKRADIWAFGCVLYEMLTGMRAFGGEDVTDTLAAVVRADPDWSALPSNTPAAIRRLLRRCLDKDRKRRLADIADARFDLDEATAEPAGETSVLTSQTQTGRRQIARLVPAFLVGVLVTALVAIVVWIVAGAPEPGAVARFEIVQPADQNLSVSPSGSDVALTPDGSAIVYRATVEGRTVLMHRRLDQLEATPLAKGVAQPTGVFVSPDGNWIGFSTGGVGAQTLQKVSAQGGPPVLIAPIEAGFAGATWGPDDVIVYAARSGLWRVPANGGDPELLLKAAAQDGGVAYRWPYFLPNGRFVMFTSVPPGPIVNAQVSVLSLDTGEQRVLVRGGTYPRYSTSGHIVYGIGGTLRAVPFRADRAEVTGGPVPVLDDVLIKASGAVDFDVASNGSLVYLPAAGASSTNLLWVDRKGSEQPILQTDQAATRPRISPDGARVALQVASDTGSDIWVYEMARGTGTRLTVDGWNEDPVWTPDGNRIVVNRAAALGLESDLFWSPSDGSSQMEPLLVRDGAQSPHMWTPDRRALAFYERSLTVPRPHRDIWVLHMDTPKAPVPILVTSFNERSPSFSPDGRWMAYASDETGQDEIYVRAYPGPGGKQTVSTDGGTAPIWSNGGTELFYRRGPSMVAVEIKTGPTLGIGASRTLFEGPYAIEGGGSGSLGYDVASDGQRFLMLKQQSGRNGGVEVNLRVVLNWLTEVARLASAN